MKCRDLKKRLKENGWEVKRQRKHPVWKHPASGKTAVLPNCRDGEDIPKGTLGSIRRQTGLELK